MDPLSSLFLAEPTHSRQSLATSASPLSSSSLSPPGSSTSLDFSMSSLSPPNEYSSSWEATLQQLAREGGTTTSSDGMGLYLAGGQPWGAAPVNKAPIMPYSFGAAGHDPRPAIASSIHSPYSSASQSSYPDYNGFSYEMDSMGGLFPATAQPGDLFAFDMPMGNVNPASLSGLPPVTISPPQISAASMAQPSMFSMPTIDRRASMVSSVSPSSLAGFEGEAAQKKRRVSADHALPIRSSTMAKPSNMTKRFAARIPPAQQPSGMLSVAPPTGPPMISTDEPAKGGKRKAPGHDKVDASTGHSAYSSTPAELFKLKFAIDAVERRYRVKINSYIVSLQNIVPALAHLVDPPDAEPTHRRKSSAFVLSTTPSIPAGTIIDGVAAAGKLSKGIVLGKSLEYIRHLKRERERYQTERDIAHTVLREYVDGHEHILAEIERRWADARDRLEDGYAKADLAEEMYERTVNARAPRRNLKGSPKGKKGKKEDSESDESDGEDEPSGVSSAHLGVYDDAALRARGGRGGGRAPSAAAAYPSPATHSSSHSQDGLTPPGPPRAMMAVFAGVSFMGGLGYDMANASGDASDASSATAVSWAPRELVKRAFVADERSGATLLAGTAAAPGSAILFLAVASVVGWLVYLAWPVFGAMLGHHRALSARRRRSAIEALHAPPKAGEGELARARRAREALTTLSRMPTHAVGAFFGLTWEALLGAVGAKGRSFGGASTEDEKAEVALALVRLAELETAYNPELCCLTQRLYAFVRLHNLSRSPMWPLDGHPALAPARVNATLALQLVSIFGSQASPLSRRRRLWKTAVTEPKRDAETVEPWVLAALGADYDEATMVARKGPICGTLSSPSDSIPLLRVAEARCEQALLDIWSSLFTSVIATTCLDSSQNESALKGETADLPGRIEQVLIATVPGSPLHTLARLTLGIYTLGAGNVEAARRIALQLALEARDAGPAAGLASVAGFARLLLGDAVAIFLHAGEPAGRLDAVATASVRWLLVRQRVATTKPPVKVDRDLYEATRSLRAMMGQEVFRASGLVEAQLRCVEALEVVGRRAAGLRDVGGESDSGFEDEC